MKEFVEIGRCINWSQMFLFAFMVQRIIFNHIVRLDDDFAPVGFGRSAFFFFFVFVLRLKSLSLVK